MRIIRKHGCSSRRGRMLGRRRGIHGGFNRYQFDEDVVVRPVAIIGHTMWIHVPRQTFANKE